MKGLVFHGAGDIRYDEVPDARPVHAVDVVVRIDLCGICGGDLHLYAGRLGAAVGFCVGHEAIGEVVEVGDAVRRWRPGDRVLIPPGVVCDGTCDGCRRGQRCARPPVIFGLGPSLPGSQADAVVVPLADANLIRLPDTISDDNALLLTDCAMTAWYGAHNARIKTGSTVAVIGLGPIGLLTVSAALLHGAARVIGIDPIADRRARAEALGAVAIRPEEADDVVLSKTRAGADSVVEVAGAPDTVAMALRLVRPGGCVSLVGTATTDDFPFPLATAQRRGVELRTGLARYVDLPGLLELVATGRFDPSVVISHRFALARGADAYELCASRTDGVCKVVLDPRGSDTVRRQVDESSMVDA